MYILEDNFRLNAVLDMPAGEPEKCPLVILIHGFTGHSEERHILAAAQTMNEKGYAVLRVDMYGHGKSDGSFREHNLFNWLMNVITAVDYARKLPFVTDLYLCGHSQGGLIVILAAGLMPEYIRGIIPMSPAVMIPAMARKGELFGIKFDPDHIPEEFMTDIGLPLSGNYVRIARMVHVEDAVARYNGPVLLIHGDADEVVPYHDSEVLVKAYQNAELVTIPGDDHCYDHHLELVLEALRKWLP